MRMWAVMVAVGVGSFVFRSGPMSVLQHTALPATVDRAIRHAGLAALSALIATSAQHATQGGSVVPALCALAAAVVLAARGTSMVRLISVGVGLYAAASVVIGVLGR